MIQEFSAVCWLFGKELSNELKVRDRHISCKRSGLGRSRTLSDDFRLASQDLIAPQAPVGLISPYLKLSPHISPQVPVGLISSSWGGTQIQVWMPKAANEACHQGSWSGTTR